MCCGNKIHFFFFFFLSVLPGLYEATLVHMRMGHKHDEMKYEDIEVDPLDVIFVRTLASHATFENILQTNRRQNNNVNHESV